MKCPHCEYEEFYTNEVTGERWANEEGEFYYLPIKMERDSTEYYKDKDRCKVVGCPKCHKIFMGDRWE